MSTHNAAGFESKDASTMSITTPLGFKAGTKTTATSYRGPLAVLALLFFMWGFLTCLNDILVPHLKTIFDLSYAKVMLIQFAFFGAYFLFSIPSAKVLDAIGYQKTMVVGLYTMALGAFLFIPAATVPSFPLFLAALVVLGAGITAQQVAANPYVSVLGPAQTASSRLNLTQAFNSLGTFLAPWFGKAFILSGTVLSVTKLHQLSPNALRAYRLHEASSVKIPYLGLGFTLLLLGIVIDRLTLPPMPTAQHSLGDKSAGSVWNHRHLVLGAVGIFAYVGAEVSIGSFLVNYLSQSDIGNISEKVAAGFVSYYWGCAMVGRFIGSAVLQRVRTGTMLGIAALFASLLVCLSMATHGPIAMWSIILVGLCNSIMFPSIFTLGIAELGRLTGDGSGLLVMAIVGGAIIPVFQGLIADRIGVHHAFILPAICYLYIVFYAFCGSKPAPSV